MYQVLCSSLSNCFVPREEPWKVDVLPRLCLEGLENLDAELHVSILVRVCAHMFLKIQKVLGAMQRHEVLTETAYTMFQIVLGNEGYGVENGRVRETATKIVDHLRGLAFTIEEPA